MGNCYDCKFAREAREHFRYGEQVRCTKAEELFGGTRWVDVLEESKCGTFESFEGDTEVGFSELDFKKKLCPRCRGGRTQVVARKPKLIEADCHYCHGKGWIPE